MIAIHETKIVGIKAMIWLRRFFRNHCKFNTPILFATRQNNFLYTSNNFVKNLWFDGKSVTKSTTDTHRETQWDGEKIKSAPHLPTLAFSCPICPPPPNTQHLRLNTDRCIITPVICSLLYWSKSKLVPTSDPQVLLSQSCITKYTIKIQGSVTRSNLSPCNLCNYRYSSIVIARQVAV